jgi:mannose-6-phosphate isomerase
VQVHPDDPYARLHHNSRGKTEMWHVLAAEPGAKIAAGFRETITPERLKSASLSGEIVSLLNWIEVAPGDTFFLPAGTVHALGGGLVLCEIQQNSDITYRLYDYGRPRELHLDQALAVSDREPRTVKQSPAGDMLVSCRHFTTKRLSVQGHMSYVPGQGAGQFLIAIEGEGILDAQPVKAGQVCYIPEKASSFEISGDLRLLSTSTCS